MSEFDEKAATWDDDPTRTERAQTIADKLRAVVDLSNVKTALEYGSGTGLLSFCLSEEIEQITLLDESVEMTRVADEKCKAQGVNNLVPLQMNLLADPLPDERFDLIFVMLTLHHVDDVEALIGIFRLLLRPGGQLAIIDLEKEDGSFHDGPFHGHKGFERNQLEKILIETGFSPETYSICYTIEKDTDSGPRDFPMFLMTAKVS
jgi:ubiquinone/menaquinone biosynthesis C-methylase UbiE